MIQIEVINTQSRNLRLIQSFQDNMYLLQLSPGGNLKKKFSRKEISSELFDSALYQFRSYSSLIKIEVTYHQGI